jgi:cytochrome c553
MIRELLRTLLIGAAIVAALVRPVAGQMPTKDEGRKAKGKRRLFEYAALLAVLGVIGLLVAASGIIPIPASSGHWPMTRWLLVFSMRRSVALHSMRIKAPPLGERALVVKGAGAYDLSCRPCHGSPDIPHPRVAQAMLPRPPYLAPIIKEWTTPQLFYIVKHGVKFTGMPAWPAQTRDDEVWAVVAFLLELPKLDAAAYQRLAQSRGAIPPMQTLAGVPRSVLDTCARCHGVDGSGRGVSAFPRLAAQRRTYLFNALQAYAAGRRHSGFMEPVAAPLTAHQMREIAQYFNSVEARPTPIGARRQDAIARGMVTASRGIPTQQVPACSDCHGPSPSRKNDAYPILAGQFADYLMLQLELFQTERRGGSRYAHLMRPVAAGLTKEQMRDVALYYESLGAR